MPWSEEKIRFHVRTYLAALSLLLVAHIAVFYATNFGIRMSMLFMDGYKVAFPSHYRSAFDYLLIDPFMNAAFFLLFGVYVYPVMAIVIGATNLFYKTEWKLKELAVMALFGAIAFWAYLAF